MQGRYILLPIPVLLLLLQYTVAVVAFIEAEMKRYVELDVEVMMIPYTVCRSLMKVATEVMALHTHPAHEMIAMLQRDTLITVMMQVNEAASVTVASLPQRMTLPNYIIFQTTNLTPRLAVVVVVVVVVVVECLTLVSA